MTEQIYLILWLSQKENPPSSSVTYDELLREVDLLEMTSIPNMDDYMANEINYSTNYTRKELNRIADYYEISKRKKRKDDIVQDIVYLNKIQKILNWFFGVRNYGHICQK